MSEDRPKGPTELSPAEEEAGALSPDQAEAVPAESEQLATVIDLMPQLQSSRTVMKRMTLHALEWEDTTIEAGSADDFVEPDIFETRRIWQEIMKGNFHKVARLTHLTPAVARKIVRMWDGPILPLRHLKVLTPEVAQELAQWKGETLWLPGVKDTNQRALDILKESRIPHIQVGPCNLREDPR